MLIVKCRLLIGRDVWIFEIFRICPARVSNPYTYPGIIIQEKLFVLWLSKGVKLPLFKQFLEVSNYKTFREKVVLYNKNLDLKHMSLSQNWHLIFTGIIEHSVKNKKITFYRVYDFCSSFSNLDKFEFHRFDWLNLEKT